MPATASRADKNVDACLEIKVINTFNHLECDLNFLLILFYVYFTLLINLLNSFSAICTERKDFVNLASHQYL